MSESYVLTNEDSEEDLLCTYVRIKADEKTVHLTNDNFAYIVDTSDSNKNVFDNGNEGEVNEDRKQFPVSLSGVYVDVDKFNEEGDSDTSVTVRPFQEVEFSLCMHLLTTPKVEAMENKEYHWAVLDNNRESLAQWSTPVSDVLAVDKTRAF